MGLNVTNISQVKPADICPGGSKLKHNYDDNILPGVEIVIYLYLISTIFITNKQKM